MKQLRLLPFLVLACCVTEGNYLVGVGKLVCDRQAECNKTAFEREYRDQRDCVDEFLDDWERIQDCAIDVGCDWEPREISECKAELRSSSCEEFSDGDWVDPCTATYDCTRSQELEILVCLSRD